MNILAILIQIIIKEAYKTLKKKLWKKWNERNECDKIMNNVGQFSVSVPIYGPVLWFGGHITPLSALTNTLKCIMVAKEKKG